MRIDRRQWWLQFYGRNFDSIVSSLILVLLLYIVIRFCKIHDADISNLNQYPFVILTFLVVPCAFATNSLRRLQSTYDLESNMRLDQSMIWYKSHSCRIPSPHNRTTSWPDEKSRREEKKIVERKPLSHYNLTAEVTSYLFFRFLWLEVSH